MRPVLWILLAAGLQAQTAPARDIRPDPNRIEPPAVGRAVIRGRVLSAETGQPLARATISAAATIGQGVHQASISTDGEGRYELVDLPAGRYEVSVSRTGYLGLQYGQRFPREAPGLLEIGEAAVIDLDFRLPRTSVLSGRVTDELGEPVAGARVTAVTRVYDVGRARLSDSPMAITDENGEYRLVGLSPGTYRVVARSNETWPSPLPGDTGTVGYTTTYFPGAIGQAEATPVTLRVGEEIGNVNFSLAPGRMATITGTAIDSQGAPLQSLLFENTDPISAGVLQMMTVLTAGVFRIPNVRPGSYLLTGMARDEFVQVIIEVTGDDLTGVSLTSRPGASMTGRLAIDPGARTSLDLSRVSIRLGDGPAPAARAVVASARPGSGRPDRDGQFTVAPVFGPTRVHVLLPSGWVLKSATRGGRDLVGATLDVPSGGALADVEIVVTDRVSSMSGVVVGDAGTPVQAGTVIVFSEDPSRWWAWTGGIRETRPDQNGTFRIDGLPAGRYAIVAVDYVETGMWFDHDYLRSLLPRAQRVNVAEDEHRQDLELPLVR